MTHSLPDYTTKYKMTTIFGNIDTAELAARLGSPFIHNREGNMIFYDDFEAENLHWDTATSGAGGAVALSTASAFMGEQSLKITGGSDTGKYGLAYRQLSLPVNTRLGYEVSFTNNADLDYVLVSMTIFDGTNYHQGRIRFDQTNDKLYYYNSANTTIELDSDVIFLVGDFMYQPIKLVIDSSTNNYVRCIFGNKEYNMSNISLYQVADASNPYLYIDLWVGSNAGDNAYSYVDHAIVTQNEV